MDKPGIGSVVKLKGYSCLGVVINTIKVSEERRVYETYPDVVVVWIDYKDEQGSYANIAHHYEELEVVWN